MAFWGSKKIVRIVKIKRREHAELDVSLKKWVWGAGNNFNPMTKIGKGSAQISDIHSLTAAMGITAVADDADSKFALHDGMVVRPAGIEPAIFSFGG